MAASSANPHANGLGADLHTTTGMTRFLAFAAGITMITGGAIAAAPPDLQARPPLVIHSMLGSDLYEFYCASCHGRDGRGGGPVAPTLKSEPPDLTRLTLRNGGVFPRARVEAIIEGRSDPPLRVHGTREMPVWGPIFRGLDASDAANRTRLGNLVDYVQSLQVKHADASRPDPTRSLATGLR